MTDGPEHTRAERLLRAAENPALSALGESLALLAEALPSPALLLDTAGNVVRATRGAAGLTAEELAGARFASLVAPEHQRAAELAIRDALSPGIAHTLDLPLLAPRGGVAWCQAEVAPVRIGERVGAVLVLTTDVSARRAEEARLRRSEEMLVDAQGTAHLGTWEWDPKSPHATWSPELYRMYGLDARTHVPSYQDYLTRVHPEDRDRVARATEEVFRDFKPYSHDERVYRPDGTLRWLHTWAKAVLDEEGKLARLVGVCQDVTEAKLAEIASREHEARYRAIVERSPLGIAALAQDGAITEANARLREMLARPVPAGTSVFELVEPDDAPALLAALERVLAATSAVERVESRVVRPRASALRARITLSLVPAAPGKAAFVACLVEDVTAEKEAEESTALAETRLARIHELEEVSEWKTHLLSVASHEIKSPLTPIKIQLHMLREGKRGTLTPDQQRAIDGVYAQADRLSKLARDVLDSALFERGQLARPTATVDASALARQVAASFREAAQEWRVALRVDAPDECLVRADADRLQQVLFNLLSNAFKFTPSGGHVSVRVTREGPDVHLRVEDTGPGLSREQQQRLFHAFSQAHEAGVGRERGAGLGLYISKSIVDAHGGRIWVESDAGRGATFHVALPAIA